MLSINDIQAQKDEIYLDNNATTPVLPQAAQAAMHTMDQVYGNPSSSHVTGLKAKYILETTRSLMRKVIGASSGEITFTSGATEGIQTAIISALNAARSQGIAQKKPVLLYGATEHKAVPETLKHWNHMLNIGAEVIAIPVDGDGILDLDFIEQHVKDAVMICTMAANNETGVFQDLSLLEQTIRKHNADVLWMVDCVQALGKIDLNIAQTTIDYAPFSGHKLYAPKGIGVLYVKQGAPFTPFIAGGGQESGLRSGTENLSGIAALQAVLTLLDNPEDKTFKDHQTLVNYRQQMFETLKEVFPDIVLNHNFDSSLPTTINFSVKGLSSKEIMDLFDAARIRVSSGSACSSKVTGSFVLDAMSKPKWQSEGAIRLSFGPATTQQEIDKACVAIKKAVKALQHSCLMIADTQDNSAFGVDGLQQWVYDQQCSWCFVDHQAKECVVIDLVPELVNKFVKLVKCQNYKVKAVLETHRHQEQVLTTEMIRALIPEHFEQQSFDPLGWPDTNQQVKLSNDSNKEMILVGSKVLARLPLAGHTENSVAYILGDSINGQLEPDNIDYVFVGDTIQIGGLGRTDLVDSDPIALYHSLKALKQIVNLGTLICPSHDYQSLFSTSLAMEKHTNVLLADLLADNVSEADFIERKRILDSQLPQSAQPNYCGQIALTDNDIGHIAPNEIEQFIAQHPQAVVVDVREMHEFEAHPDAYVAGKQLINVPLSQLTEFVHSHKPEQELREYVCICRSGNRSDAAAKVLQRNGFAKVYHVPGGFALLS